MDDRMRASLAVERGLEAGDVLAARQALGDPPGWPNVVDPYLGDTVLALAIARAPADAIRQLLAQGADPNFHPLDDGFPALVDVLHHRRGDRWDDTHDVLRALLDAGADVHARGLNDGTALHFACWYDDPVAVRILLDAGANPDTRTRIDDYESPREIADRAGGEAQRAMAEWLDAHR